LAVRTRLDGAPKLQHGVKLQEGDGMAMTSCEGVHGFLGGDGILGVSPGGDSVVLLQCDGEVLWDSVGVA
jgi:hypothetical protein